MFSRPGTGDSRNSNNSQLSSQGNKPKQPSAAVTATTATNTGQSDTLVVHFTTITGIVTSTVSVEVLLFL